MKGGTVFKADGPEREGPGQVFTSDLIASGAGYGSVKRVRNVGASPLELAWARRKICKREYEAGALFAALYGLRSRSGRDSTDMDSVRGSAASEPWTQTQVNAIRDLQEIEERLSAADARIIARFCGDGFSIAESVARVVPVHPSGTIYRLREALTHLADCLALLRLRSRVS